MRSFEDFTKWTFSETQPCCIIAHDIVQFIYQIIRMQNSFSLLHIPSFHNTNTKVTTSCKTKKKKKKETEMMLETWRGERQARYGERRECPARDPSCWEFFQA